MVISLRKWFRWGKLLFLFILCTYLFYQVINWFVPWIFPDLWNDRPGDGAVKVITLEKRYRGWTHDVKNRLYYFYWTGE